MATIIEPPPTFASKQQKERVTNFEDKFYEACAQIEPEKLKPVKHKKSTSAREPLLLQGVLFVSGDKTFCYNNERIIYTQDGRIEIQYRDPKEGTDPFLLTECADYEFEKKEKSQEVKVFLRRVAQKNIEERLFKALKKKNFLPDFLTEKQKTLIVWATKQ